MTARVLIVLIAAVSALFWIWPGIDLWASGLFFSAETRFPRGGVLDALRYGVWGLAVIVALGALVLAIFPRWRPRGFWLRVVALFALGPGLVVNGILKSYWHRPRPSRIEEFGGPLDFTPVWQIAGGCPTNCSFVSGEASGAAATALVLVALSPRLWPLALVVVVLGAGLRVVMGGHFLSDVVLAVLITALIGRLVGVYPRTTSA